MFKISFSFQTHPNVDKKLFNQESILGMKQSGKPYPLNADISVLKWRLQSTDESLMPLSSKLFQVKLSDLYRAVIYLVTVQRVI